MLAMGQGTRHAVQHGVYSVDRRAPGLHGRAPDGH
jgi:hypothetical protein